MKKLVLALVVMALLGSLGVAQYHDPVWVVGNYYATTSTYYEPGVFKLDGHTSTYTTILSPQTDPTFKHYYLYGTQMDANNKDILLTIGGTSSTIYSVNNGLFRVNTATGTWSTIVQGNYGQNGPHYNTYRGLFINQDGDYLFSAYARSQVTTPTTTTRYDYHILKYDASNTLSTFFSSYMLGNAPYERAYFYGGMRADINSGDILTNTGYYNSSSLSKLGPYPWIKIDPNTSSKWSTFAAGTYPNYYGRYCYYGMVGQNYATGDIEDPYYGRVYRTKMGGTGFTTLWNWGYPGGWNFRYGQTTDLQSAPAVRWVNTGYWIQPHGTSTGYGPGICYLYGAPTYGSQMFNFDPTASRVKRYGCTYYSYGVDWWGGRHIQSVMTGANKWQIRYSCPNYAGKNYFAVLGMSGHNPGIPLPSGRTIWINFDALVFLSLNNILLPFWSGGPGVLDANGEAQGFLNTSLIAPLNGMTVHIAMIVMDAAAPDGIAYIPDTYVMKLP